MLFAIQIMMQSLDKDYINITVFIVSLCLVVCFIGGNLCPLADQESSGYQSILVVHDVIDCVIDHVSFWLMFLHSPFAENASNSCRCQDNRKEYG